MGNSPKLKLVIHRFPAGEVIATSIFDPAPITPPAATDPPKPPSTPIIPYRPPKDDEE